jgi:hypothetical protein
MSFCSRCISGIEESYSFIQYKVIRLLFLSFHFFFWRSITLVLPPSIGITSYTDLKRSVSIHAYEYDNPAFSNVSANLEIVFKCLRLVPCACSLDAARRNGTRKRNFLKTMTGDCFLLQPLSYRN